MACRCLWLARELPFPEDSGDRVHSAHLAQALAQAGADLTFVGLDTDAAWNAGPPPVQWHGIGGGPRPVWRALLSAQPLQAALRATPAYRRVVNALLLERWDAVVLDHYGSSWLLPAMRRARAGIDEKPVLVHVSHNHETSLWQQMAELVDGPAWKRVGVQQNAWKVRHAEQRLAQGVDLLCCITGEDAQAFAASGVTTPSLVLTPGYAGRRVAQRRIDADTPRRVVLVGSFRWVAKQENVRALVQQAADAFSQHGITLDIVGDMPEALRDELGAHPAVRLHGFVDDLRPLLAEARMALVPEAIGGGFKLKLLDYVFHRVPVVTLQAAAAGLPLPLMRSMMVCANLPSLIDAVIMHFDDVPLLDRLQNQAFDAARTAFEWSDRGRALLAAIRYQASHRDRPPLPWAALPGSAQPHSSRYNKASYSGDSR